MSENVDTRIYTGTGNLIGLLLCLRISMLENPVQECFNDHDDCTRILYYAKGDFCRLLKASISGADRGFLEKGFICIKGFALLIVSNFY